MYGILIEFMQFLGIGTSTPETVGDFLVWFVLVCVAFSMLKYIFKLLFDLDKIIAGGRL